MFKTEYENTAPILRGAADVFVVEGPAIIQLRAQTGTEGFAASVVAPVAAAGRVLWRVCGA